MSTPSDNGSSSTPVEVRHGTLPPPEWTASADAPVSAATLALELHEVDPPVSRRTGPRAELAFHQARVRAYHATNDTEGERASATALARALVTRGTDLDAAAKLARRALLIGHDLSLREELSAWFAALGEPALAATTLRPLVAELSGPDSARVLTRIGVLLGRAGDAGGAADALFDAARDDPSDPIAPELQAGIGAWASSAVSPERAAEGYLEGFRRRDAAGDRAAGFEDLLRAFEMAPGEPQPAERLAAALVLRGRIGAADEVLREHARASADRARAIHVKRMRDFADSDLPRSLGAAFDARLDSESDLERAFGSNTRQLGFDDLLERAGLHELVAARIELACEDLVGSERALARMTLSILYSGALASPERAVEAWVDALLADPENHDAWTSLKNELSATGDAHAWVDAALRSSPKLGRAGARGGGATRRRTARAVRGA